MVEYGIKRNLPLGGGYCTLTKAFAAEIKPWGAGVTLEVNFHGRGFYPPLALPVSYTHLDVYKRQG